MQTIGDLIRETQPLTIPIRREIAAKLTSLERALSPLFDNLLSVASGIEECRALLAADDKDDPDFNVDDDEIEGDVTEGDLTPEALEHNALPAGSEEGHPS